MAGLVTRERTYKRRDGSVAVCEERYNEKYEYVASRIYRIDGAFGVLFMPYYVSTGEEYFHKSEGGIGLKSIEEARAVLSTYASELEVA